MSIPLKCEIKLPKHFREEGSSGVVGCAVEISFKNVEGRQLRINKISLKDHKKNKADTSTSTRIVAKNATANYSFNITFSRSELSKSFDLVGTYKDFSDEEYSFISSFTVYLKVKSGAQGSTDISSISIETKAFEDAIAAPSHTFYLTDPTAEEDEHGWFDPEELPLNLLDEAEGVSGEGKSEEESEESNPPQRIWSILANWLPFIFMLIVLIIVACLIFLSLPKEKQPTEPNAELVTKNKRLKEIEKRFPNDFYVTEKEYKWFLGDNKSEATEEPISLIGVDLTNFMDRLNNELVRLDAPFRYTLMNTSELDRHNQRNGGKEWIMHEKELRVYSGSMNSVEYVNPQNLEERYKFKIFKIN